MTLSQIRPPEKRSFQQDKRKLLTASQIQKTCCTAHVSVLQFCGQSLMSMKARLFCSIASCSVGLTAFLTFKAMAADGLGGSSSAPSVTITAQEAEVIENKASDIASEYCSLLAAGKPSDEALSKALENFKYIPNLPKSTQRSYVAKYLVEAESCKKKEVVGAEGCEIEINGWRPKTCGGGPNLRTTSRSWGPPQARNRKPSLSELLSELTDLTQAIEENPQNASLYLRRGWIFYFAKDFTRAISDFNAAIRLSPGDSLSYGLRGATKFYTDDSLGARLDLTRALALNPSNAFATQVLARMKYKDGDLVASCDLFKRAAALEDPEARLYLAANKSLWCRSLP